MSLEHINTMGTLTTVAIVAATAIAALVQLRHLRAGNQINAMISLGNQFDEKAYREALALVQNKLASALEDSDFREYIAAFAICRPAAAVTKDYIELRSALILLGSTYEELGILVKNGIVDKELFLDRNSWPIVRTWNRLELATAFVRRVPDNNALRENFEYLIALSQDWMREHPSAYPVGVRRLQLPEMRPIPAQAT